MERQDKRIFAILATWALLALTTTWIVAATQLRLTTPLILFPSSIGISAATFDPTLGLWVCDIALTFGVLGACHMLISALRPDQAKVKTRSDYWRRMVPLAGLMTALLVWALVANLTPGIGHSRGDVAFRLLASTVFGLGFLAAILTTFFAATMWLVLQTVRIGYHIHATAP